MLRSTRPLFARLRSIITLGSPRVLAGKLCILGGMLVIGAVAFFLGRSIGLGQLGAQQPNASLGDPKAAAAANPYGDEYSGRVVAYIYGNVPITRQDLAEHLISRYGPERIEFLVNRMIVERACKQAGIFVTDNEIEVQFQKDLRSFGPHMTAKLFQEQILSRYKKTIYEWKEDVVRQKLMLAKLVYPTVVVTEEDIHKGFEARFGPKVQCRMIVFQNDQLAIKTWQAINSSGNIEKGFKEEAQKQFIPDLAATAGKIDPIHKHFGDANIERDAFNLKPGQMSQVIGMPDKTAIILMCEQHLAATPVQEKDERLKLHKDIFDMKLAKKIQDQVVELRKQANPRILLARQQSFDQIERDAAEFLNDTKDLAPKVLQTGAR